MPGLRRLLHRCMLLILHAFLLQSMLRQVRQDIRAWWQNLNELSNVQEGDLAGKDRGNRTTDRLHQQQAGRASQEWHQRTSRWVLESGCHDLPELSGWRRSLLLPFLLPFHMRHLSFDSLQISCYENPRGHPTEGSTQGQRDGGAYREPSVLRPSQIGHHVLLLHLPTVPV